MKLRTKLLALIVAASSVGNAHAGGCGSRGGVSIGFGGSGISIGHGHVSVGRGFPSPQSIPHPHFQAQHHTPAPVQYHSMPSNYSQPMAGYQPSFPSETVYPNNAFVHAAPQQNGVVPQNMSVPQNSLVPQNSRVPQNMSVPPNASVPENMSVPPNASVPQNMSVPQNASVPQNMALPQNTAARQNVSAPTNSVGSGNTNVPVNNGSNGHAELSALRILASIDGGVAADEVAPATESNPTAIATATQLPPGHFGNWVVNLNENQTIRLALNQDNTFAWQAMKDGKESSFQGQYRMEGERLVLVRSSDLQQMSGSWTGSGSNFTFKLDGANDSGLSFARGR